MDAGEAAPGASATARFVAVGAPAEPSGPPGDARPPPHCVARRLRSAALDAAVAGGPTLVTLCATALAVTAGAQLAAASGRSTAATVALLLMALAAGPWLLPDVAGRARERWRLHAGAALACVALLAGQPWLASGDASHVLGLSMIALGTVATVAAATLAPWTPGATAAALLPLSPAWLALREADGVAAAGSLFACAAAMLVGWSRRRAWQGAMRATLQREERIEALLQERDQACRADAEKSRFLAIASHDLRQPVHALGLFAATLDRRLRGTREEPLVRNIIRSIDGLERSFNAMLDISRLDAGTIEPSMQHFPLRDLFRRLHMHFAGQAERRDLGLRFWPGGKSVSSDPQLLERVLGNLVQNAIKYTAEGGVVVVARSTATHVNVEIWDTGMGIAAEELPQVFDEFYQVGRNDRSRVQGLGMGLAIVKRLCRLLGVRLSVASRLGHGTMFRVGIPLTSLAEIGPVTAAADTLPQPTSLRTVLILDDEGPIREGLRLLLEEWGYEAITAGTIAEAERTVMALGTPLHLILSDLHLGPGADGIAAIAAIRNQCGHDVPAVLITGDTSPAEIARVGESGHPVLFKPVLPGKLYEVVRTAIV